VLSSGCLSHSKLEVKKRRIDNEHNDLDTGADCSAFSVQLRLLIRWEQTIVRLAFQLRLPRRWERTVLCSAFS
jgi:hypothetical protein